MKQRLFLIILSLLSVFSYSQNDDSGAIHGNFQLSAQTYKEDQQIGANKAPEHMLMNSYANLIYTKGKFSAGTRFEGYLNTLQGFEPKNEGTGFPHRWAKYSAENLEVTVGSYYEQFGSGLIFRTYEDKNLGYDNAMDGIRLKYNVGNGIILKAVYGQQRLAQQYSNDIPQLIRGRGIVRGIDAELSLNDMLTSLEDKKTRVLFGGSFISKYEKDDDPTYKIPENVGAGAGRINIARGKVNLMGEYVYKSMDPSASGTDNSNGNVGQSYIYKPGQGFLFSATYSQKGLGIFLMGKYLDNMNFRSERTAKLNNLSINYIPDITKNHTYAFAAMYPYGTQPNGEAGIQAEILYKFNKETMFGGKYGTLLTLGYSRMNSIQKEVLNDTTSLVANDGTEGYNATFLSIGDELFNQDINIEINKKFSKKLKGILTLQSLQYDNSIIHGAPLAEGVINAFAIIADATYKIEKKKAIRTEIQHISVDKDKGNWASVLIEYSIPHWFFIIGDQYNYGHPEADKQTHYYNASVVYTNKANRFQIGYGRQREGIECSGGVCRRVPAANGLMVSITSSF